MHKFVVALLLSISAGAHAATEAEIAERMRQAEPKGKEAVLAKLKDPSSAEFRNLRPAVTGLYLCGEVNAKNSYGGYTGFKKFYSLWQMNMANIEGEGNYISSTFQEKCGG